MLFNTLHILRSDIDDRFVRIATIFRCLIFMVFSGATLGHALAKAKSGGAVDRLNGPAIANTGGLGP